MDAPSPTVPLRPTFSPRAPHQETPAVADTGDQPVLAHIQKLHDEEQRLFAKNALSDDERR